MFLKLLFVVLTFLLGPVKPENSDPEESIQGTELLFTYVVHRHGDRMPDQGTQQYAYNKEALAKIHDRYGYGELTNTGKRRSYQLGKYLRWRYEDLLSWEYNSTEINIYSTDVKRTQMTCLTAMAAVYPAIERWNGDINWVPTPYTTKPLKNDPTMAFVSCPTYEKVFFKTLNDPTPKIDRFKPLWRRINEIYGENFKFVPNTLFSLYNTLLSEMHLGIELGPELMALIPELKEAHSAIFAMLFESDESVKAQSGFLQYEFFRVVDGFLNGTISQRVWIFSGHDVNVYALLRIAGVPIQDAPEYCASFALELRRDVKTDQLFVLPVYLPSPEESQVYLQVEDCGGLLCDLDQFRSLTKEHLIDEKEWTTYCECSDDFVVDSNAIW